VPEIAAQILAHLVEAGEVPLRRLSTAALNALRNQPGRRLSELRKRPCARWR
jgi:hypothetical protein